MCFNNKKIACCFTEILTRMRMIFPFSQQIQVGINEAKVTIKCQPAEFLPTEYIPYAMKDSPCLVPGLVICQTIFHDMTSLANHLSAREEHNHLHTHVWLSVFLTFLLKMEPQTSLLNDKTISDATAHEKIGKSGSSEEHVCPLLLQGEALKCNGKTDQWMDR